MTAPIRPAEEPRVDSRRFAPGHGVPNHPTLPAVILRRALTPPMDTRELERLLAAHGWGGTWLWEVFPYHHYHPDAHEVLTVVRGSARLMLGGAGGSIFEVEAGDVVVLPAGTGHEQVEKSGGFQVCGAYPRGQENYSTIRAEAGFDEGIIRQIARVALPRADPIYGIDGPLMNCWTVSR
ncbi:MAG: cupin domain-containing protein [Geminicoccaceae bacterium]|nr:cupin domain-containing protein [Geminicoccaceae bacterium]